MVVDKSSFQFIQNLYQQEDKSDVTFVFNEGKLHANRLILSERSKYFNNKFADSANVTYKYNDKYRLAPFDLMLKWIYAIRITLANHSTRDVIDLIRLSDQFLLSDLMDFAISRLKENRITVDTVGLILNESLLLTQKRMEKLTSLCSDFLERNAKAIVEHASFTELSLESVTHVLKLRLCVPEGDILKAVVGWMNANSGHKFKFLQLAKLIDTNLLNRNHLMMLVRPGKLISDNEFVDILYEQPDKIDMCQEKHIKIPQENGARFVEGKESLLFGGIHSVKHRIDGENGRITVDLKRHYLLNCLIMKLMGDRSYTVSVSSDRETWTQIIDRSNYVCHGLQELHFNDVNVRCIRIQGTSPIGHDFTITNVEVLYCPDRYEIDHRTTLFVPLQNVATINHDAIVLNNRSNGILDKASLQGTDHIIGNGGITVKLTQPFLLDSLKLKFSYMVDYKYFIEVSTDGQNWNEVVNRSNVSMMKEEFPRQPVMYIKIVGTHAVSDAFECLCIEAPALGFEF